jgi:NDP-sugar pyrophosphorylase family protein
VHAVIVAGGEGQRLRPYTENRPKAMVEIDGKPLLEYQLGWLRDNGVTDVVVVCGYRAEALQQHFRNGESVGLRISYAIEETPRGRGGGFKLGFGMVPAGEAEVIGTNGDVLCGQPLPPVLEFHRRHRALATVLLAQLRSPYGIATLREDGQVMGFEEKPLLPYWLNAGVYVFSRDVLHQFPDRGDHEDTTFPALARQGRLYGFRSQAPWRAVDTVKDLIEAGNELRAARSGAPAAAG